MSKVRGVINNIKREGIKKTMQKSVLKLLGISKQQEEIDTLYYFLNHLVDANTIGPTKNEELRMMQYCDVALLNIFHRVCQKHNLTYWLDFGTLLGAVRHKGFIPWDDDMDVSMPREDYEKVLDILKDEVEQYGIEINWGDGRIGLGYKHIKTGVWLDIFVVDTFRTDRELCLIKDELMAKSRKYGKFYEKNRLKGNNILAAKRKEIMGDSSSTSKKIIIFHSLEFDHMHTGIFERKTILPFQPILFEGLFFNAPCDYDTYLRELYGSRYMQFPHGGVEHHDGGRGKLSSWASRNNIGMHIILKELQDIADKI